MEAEVHMATAVAKGGGSRVTARAAAPSSGILVVMLLALAVIAGTMPSAALTGSAPPHPAALDYSPDPPGRVAAVRSQFIVDQLGLSFAPLAPPTDVPTVPVGAGVKGAPDTIAGPARAAVVDKEFRCVGDRQTQDPLAPPCDDSVFTGDNGGATWKGVEREEVRILVRVRGGGPYAPPAPARSGPEAGASPADTYLDLGLPPRGDEPLLVTPLRDLQTYFNRRYQTFGRKVRLVVYFDDGHTHPPGAGRDLAAENDLISRPFSMVSLIRAPFVENYMEALAQRRIVAFDGEQNRSQQFFDRQPGMLWGYHASVEQQAALYASYVCKKVIGHPVSISGEPLANGRPRRLALLYTSNPSRHDFIELGRRIRKQITECGGEIVDEARYRTNGEDCTNLPHEQDEGDIARARDDLARFRSRGVTTILWPGCPTSAHPLAASAAGWFPEWVLTGDPNMAEAALAGTLAGAGAVWDRHAVMVSARPFQPPAQRTRCWSALEEIAPADDEVSGRYKACEWFGALQQVFTGIQLAGPTLTPTNLTAGFRRLRVEASSDPQVPTCAYEFGDAACIKDGQALLFDLRGGAAEFEPPPGLGAAVPYDPGACWRAIESGKRYLPGEWPSGNVEAQVRADDPCTYDQQQVVRNGIVVGRK